MNSDELTAALEASLIAVGIDPAEVEVNVTDVAYEEQTYCPGSGMKPKKAGSKYYHGRIKYRCPSCQKHYTTDANGRMNKHGYKIAEAKKKAKPRKAKAHCAECSQPVYELDYLCERCRGA